MRRTGSILALVLLIAVPTAWAQDCVLGVYGNTVGTEDYAWTWRNEAGLWLLDIYYVVYTEGYALGVSWYREQLSQFDILASEIDWQSYATFLETTEYGWRIGLGLCQAGYGGKPITIMKESLVIANAPYENAEKSPYAVPAFQVIANPIQNPNSIMAADCSGTLRPCEAANPLYVYFATVPIEGETFGRIKAMFR